MWEVKILQLQKEQRTRNGRLVTGSLFQIGGRQFHVECQSNPDGTMSLRMIEYGFAAALQEAWDKKSNVIQLPDSCVLYLRHTRNTPRELNVTLKNAQGESMSYTSKVILAQEYDSEALFQKELWMLLPFYVLRYEKQLDEIEGSNEKLAALLEEYRTILGQLEAATREAEKPMLYADLCRLMQDVSNYVLRKYAKTQQAMDGIMIGGNAMKLYSAELREEGFKEGVEKERKESEKKLAEKDRINAALAAEIEVLRKRISALEASHA